MGNYLGENALPDFFDLIGRDGPPTRDVLSLRVADLISPQNRPHRRREPVVIQGEAVSETMRERLTRETRELEVAIAALANQLAKRTEQLEHLKRFPEQDPFEDGTALQFDKSFPGTPDDKYSYLANRVDGLWYLTGARSPQAITWDQFVSWMGLGVDTVWQLNYQSATGRNLGKRKVIG